MELQVKTPLRLRKTPVESLKTVIQEAGLRLGLDIRGYRGLKARFHAGGDYRGFGHNLTTSEHTGEDLAQITKSSGDALAFYEELLKDMPAEEFQKNAQFATVPMVEHVLSSDKQAGRVVSIGSCYARVEAHLADKHPDVYFSCIDFPPNLESVNKPNARQNISFHGQYPLQWLRKSEEKFDLALFNRVLCIVTIEEFRAYLDALATRVRYIVFGEQTKLHTFAFGLNLDALDRDKPLRLRNHFVYNYRAVFERAGFRMIHYVAKRSPLTKEHGPQHCMILGIAKNGRL